MVKKSPIIVDKYIQCKYVEMCHAYYDYDSIVDNVSLTMKKVLKSILKRRLKNKTQLYINYIK